MGNVPSFSFENRDDMRRKLEEEMEKAKGTYWNRHESVWDKQLEEFEGYFAVYKGVRKEKDIAHYVDLRCLLEHNNEIVPGRGDNAGTKNHSKKHLKTIRGRKICETNKSKAHLLPNDPVCNEFWLPELHMVLGNTADATGTPAKALEWAARTHTNKLVFGMEHYHFFDDLEYGNILAIPLFESFEGVGQWNYKQPYEMLIVCDSIESYRQVGILGDENHVEMASCEDVQRATQLLSTATKILADSLLVNSDFYDNAGDGSGESQKRMSMMKG
ncbi:expressed unknown protein [Seminavis robusta]|uniref:Uncharacterized protein n=1 Tax=Seminavis robusta TaxID=568900 RepID=A0A9N8F1X7_9STRA|nr:expressed unknown protein [Seminavis robusta]|eukprot:Sro2341_g324090.2  (273) ;mRNA; f:11034-11947